MNQIKSNQLTLTKGKQNCRTMRRKSMKWKIPNLIVAMSMNGSGCFFLSLSNVIQSEINEIAFLVNVNWKSMMIHLNSHLIFFFFFIVTLMMINNMKLKTRNTYIIPCAYIRSKFNETIQICCSIIFYSIHQWCHS